jgi:nickel-dependent lactate racemase
VDASVSLPFGSSFLELNRPKEIHSWSVLRPAGPDGEKRRRAPEESIIREALGKPIGSPPLFEIVRPGNSVCVVTSDVTRYCGAERFLPVLIGELTGAGVSESDITILFALGIHRPQTETERRHIVGEEVFRRIRCVDHDAYDDARMTEVGELRLPIGTGETARFPLRINSHAAEADRLILTGVVGLHYLAGFGGGGKALLPGISSADSCMALHRMTLNPDGPGRHPNVGPARLAGNPVQETIRRAVDLVRPDFLLNTVLDPSWKENPDSTGNPRFAAAVAGDPLSAFPEGCEIARRYETVEVPEPADLVIVSGGGNPRDINFIQSHKALDHASRAVREGGTILCAARCPDGPGHPSFGNWFRFRTPEEFESALREKFEIYGQTAYATFLKSRRYRIIWVSELDPGFVRVMGLEPASSLEEGLERALSSISEVRTCLVIPDGSAVLPVLKSGGA